jgi:hypothetical protein
MVATSDAEMRSGSTLLLCSQSVAETESVMLQTSDIGWQIVTRNVRGNHSPYNNAECSHKIARTPQKTLGILRLVVHEHW